MRALRFPTLMLLLAAAPFSTARADQDAPAPRLITVTGTADVKIIPDEVVLTLGVETLDMDINKAKRDNDERVKRVFALTEKYGIKPKHVQTDHVGIQPHFEYENRRNVFKGYKVQQTIAVTLHDLSNYEPLLTDLLKQNVNRIHGVNFRVQNSRPHKDQARLMAIRAAKEKAVALAAALDQRVGRPHTIVEQASTSNPWGKIITSDPNSNSLFVTASQGSAEGTIAPGMIVIRATISVSFELEPSGQTP